MLCDTCQRKGFCLPSKLSDDDHQLRNFLERMKRCELRVPEPHGLKKRFFRWPGRSKQLSS